MSILNGHMLSISALCYSGNGRLLLSGSREGSLRLWEVENSRCLDCMTIPRMIITDAIWHPDPAEADTVFVAAAEDLKVRLWDRRMELSQPAWTLPVGTHIPRCLEIRQNTIYAGCQAINGIGGGVYAWDLRRMPEDKPLWQCCAGESIRHLSTSPIASWIYASSDSRIVPIDPVTGECAPASWILDQLPSTISATALDSQAQPQDDKHCDMLLAGFNSGGVALWRQKDGQWCKVLETQGQMD
mgnify:CR=1 FL=1